MIKRWKFWNSQITKAKLGNRRKGSKCNSGNWPATSYAHILDMTAHLYGTVWSSIGPSISLLAHWSIGPLNHNHFSLFPLKGDIFSSLENVVLVANVNKNYRSHSHLQRSGLIVSSVLKYWRSCPFCRSLPVQSSAILFLFNKSKLELRKNSGKNRLPQIQFRLDVWLS